MVSFAYVSLVRELIGNGVVMNLLILVPAIGFVVAAGAGIVVRSRRARQNSRDTFSING